MKKKLCLTYNFWKIKINYYLCVELKNNIIMKKINELTDQEILSLSHKDLTLMIRHAIAEAGIPFKDKPTPIEKPAYPSPSNVVYYCSLLGNGVSFADINELNSIIDALKKCKSICSISSDYIAGTPISVISKELRNSDYSSNTPFTISSRDCYDRHQYTEVRDLLASYDKDKKNYEALSRDYDVYLESIREIEDGIMAAYNCIIKKYEKLNYYVYLYKTEYMVLADNNEEVAMNFLTKAYGLSKEDEKYVLDNYKKEE